MDLVERQAVKSYWDGGQGVEIRYLFLLLVDFLIGVFFYKGAKQKIASMRVCNFL